VRIAIAGPGRSGTSLLVLLFREWGFVTPALEGNWAETAQAGLESRIGAGSPFEIDKDPWAYEYLDALPKGALQEYDAFILPLRDRVDAALSRSIQERAHRARGSDQDVWKWDTSGSVPGGAVSDTSREAISATLEAGLWDLLEVITRAGIQPILLNFPKFAQDFDYLWAQLSALVSSRIDEASARAIWARVVDQEKIQLRSKDAHQTPEELELRALVEILHSDLHDQKNILDQVKNQRDIALEQRDEALEGRKDIEESRTWRAMAWWRHLRRNAP
jgi:hypothetical protein